MKKVITVLIVGMLTLSLIACGDDESNKKEEKLVWPESGISLLLPVPNHEHGEVWLENTERFSAYIHNVSLEDYEVYEKECEDKGFNIVNVDESDEFDAYNADGYRVTLSYSGYSKEISIDIYSPKVNSELVWPTIGLATLIPQPKGTMGTVSIDSSSQLSVYVGETTIEDYNTYVDECIKQGFDVDYNKGDKVFSAHDIDGTSLRIEYEGFNTMFISMYVSSDEKDTEETENGLTSENETQKLEDETNNKPSSNEGISVEFKEAMDNYEAFFDEYIAFMEKYINSDDALSLVSDYTDYMSRYAETMEKLNNMDNEELTDEELVYYAEVMARISKKLAESVK